jgi:transcriptional regulator with GAF, ATPase, and Fis domain
VSGRRDEYVKKAEEMLRGTRWEPDVQDAREELRRSAAAAAPGEPADDQNRLLLKISETLNSHELSFEEVAVKALHLAIKYLKAERGVIFFLDERNRFKPIAQANVESQCVADAMEFSESVLRRAAEDHVLWSGDAMTDQRFSQYESIHAFNIRSFMCVPLKSRGKIVGTVYVDNRSIENRFDQPALDFVRLFANVTGIALENARVHDGLKAENRELRTEIKRSMGAGRVIVGEDPKIKRILSVVERVADSNATVLVIGESGTGKEMVARAIHQGSNRLGRPFVTLNCAAIPEQLLESELFGYVKGAFTGAQGTKIGKFEAADKGTLFLDEIGDMTFPLQAKILRVLQEGTFEPLGSNRVKEVDVRIVAATNRNLAKMVEEGSFREDLYYRLNVIVLDLPPLRDRRVDIPKLAEHFLERCRTSRTQVQAFSPEAMVALQAHPWPGNIRELENCVMRLALLTPHAVVEVADVRPLLETGGPGARPQPAATLVAHPVRPLDELEREAIVAALGHFEGNRTAAAQALGISVRTLQYKIKEYQAAGVRIP